MALRIALGLIVLVATGAVRAGDDGAPRPAGDDEREREVKVAADRVIEARKEGRFEDARREGRRLLELRRGFFGEASIEYADALTTLAQLAEKVGDLAAVQRRHDESADVLEKIHGKGDWRVTDARILAADAGDRAEFTPEQQKTFEKATALDRKRAELRRQRKIPEAIAAGEQAIELFGQLYGEEHLRYSRSLQHVANLYDQIRQNAKARPLFEKAVVIERAIRGGNHPVYAIAIFSLANVLFGQREYDRAENLYNEAAGILRQAYGEEHGLYAMVRHGLAAVYRKRGDVRRAVEVLKEIIALDERVPSSPRRAGSHAARVGELATAYGDLEEFAKANVEFERALVLMEKSGGVQNLNYTRLLANYAEHCRKIGRYGRAEELITRALELEEKGLGPLHRYTVNTRHSAAAIALLRGEYSRGAELLRDVLEAREASRDTDPGYARALDAMASAQQGLGDFAEAERLRQEALALIEKAVGTSHRSHLVARLNLARLYRLTGELPRAEEMLRELLPVVTAQPGVGQILRGQTLAALAEVCSDAGRYGEAESHYRDALAIFARHAPDGEDYASATNGLAVLHSAIGDLGEAEILYESALALYADLMSVENPFYLQTLSNLAETYRRRGRFDEALQRLSQVASVRARVLGKGHPEYAQSLIRLGRLHRDTGDLDEAEKRLLAALEIGQRLSRGHRRRVEALAALVSVELRKGELERAAEYASERLESMVELSGPSHFVCSDPLRALGEVHFARGEYERAAARIREALEIERAHLAVTAGASSERRRLLLVRSARRTLGAYLAAAAASGVDANTVYDAVLPLQGAVFARERLVRIGASEPVHRPLVAEIRSVSSRLAAVAFSRPEAGGRESWNERLLALSRQKDALEKRLEQESAGYRRERASARGTARTLAAALPPGSLLVDFVVYDALERRERAGDAAGGEPRERVVLDRAPHVAAFVVRSGQPVEWLRLGSLDPIAAAVDAWRTALDGGPNASNSSPVALAKRFEQPAAELRKTLLQPLGSRLKGARLLLVSPDGPLSRLPFAALPGDRSGSYLIDDLAVVQVPVTQMLPVELVRRAAEDPGSKDATQRPALLLVGDVDFDGEPASAELAAAGSGARNVTVSYHRGPARSSVRGGTRGQWRALPFTRTEISVVASQFERAVGGEVTRLDRLAATESEFRVAASRHGYLHVATHGFFAPPEIASIVADRTSELQARDVVGWHPGLLSGVVFAGANRSRDGDDLAGTDDGILTALELGRLDLEGVELLVLSGCETGLGRSAGGEGLLGLQRAAQVAGARTVVASLWQVDDRITMELMRRFYENLWQRKLSRVEALRQAQLAIRRGEVGKVAKDRDEKTARGPGAVRKFVRSVGPGAWAGWVLSGDWR